MNDRSVQRHPGKQDVAGYSSRVVWLDSLRGAAIGLVILHHSVAVPGLLGFGTFSAIETLNDAFTLYRIPLLVALSGFMLSVSLNKKGRHYYQNKVRSLVYPYILWSTLILAMGVSQFHISEPVAWVGTSYLWYLFCITCYYFVAPFVTAVPPLLISVLAMVVSHPLDEGLTKTFFYCLAFFFFGHFVRSSPGFCVLLSSMWSRIGLVALVAVGSGVAVWLGPQVSYRAEFGAFSLAGVVLALAFGGRCRALCVRSWLGFLGEHSLIYYLVHFPLMVFVCRAFGAMGVSSVAVMAMTGLVGFFAVGTWLARRCSLCPWSWLFRMPQFGARPR